MMAEAYLVSIRQDCSNELPRNAANCPRVLEQVCAAGGLDRVADGYVCFDEDPTNSPRGILTYGAFQAESNRARCAAACAGQAGPETGLLGGQCFSLVP
jgi:hypothetical protein